MDIKYSSIKKIIQLIYSYSIYYKAPEHKIKRANSTITTSDSYRAIILKTASVRTLFFFIEKAYNKVEADVIRLAIYNGFYNKLDKTTDVETLVFLYNNLPDYIKMGHDREEDAEKKPYKLPDELLWKHFNAFIDYDEGSDASYYVLNTMTLITPKFCMKKFLEDQSLVLKIYNGLDDRNAFEAFFGGYPFSETFSIGNNTFEATNKDLFVTLLNSYIQLYENDPDEIAVFESSGAHFYQGTKIGGLNEGYGFSYELDYTLDSNIIFSNSGENKNKVKITNYWKIKEDHGEFFNQSGGVSNEYNYRRGINEDGYYNPLDVVKFTQYNDKGEAVTFNTPALFVKYASDLKEWEKVNEGIRLWG